MSENRQNVLCRDCGGAISGSVAAGDTGRARNSRVAVIEQNKRPYGKIEDGLPRWHVDQRKQEYGRIDARLRKSGVYFVPCVKLGRDLDFMEFCNRWGFSAVIPANGVLGGTGIWGCPERKGLGPGA